MRLQRVKRLPSPGPRAVAGTRCKTKHKKHVYMRYPVEIHIPEVARLGFHVTDMPFFISELGSPCPNFGGNFLQNPVRHSDQCQPATFARPDKTPLSKAR